MPLPAPGLGTPGRACAESPVAGLLKRLLGARGVAGLGWLAGAAPAVPLAVQALGPGGLGADPVETLTHTTGETALRLLLLSLAITPLRRGLGWARLAPLRRVFGLSAFFWLMAHFSVYLYFDLGFLFSALAEEIAERPYITLGFGAWLLLTPLAITSTRGWQRRLGRRWNLLHRAVYPAALLAVGHFLWLTKADLREPLVYAGLLALLLAPRIYWSWRRRRPGPGPGGRGAAA